MSPGAPRRLIVNADDFGLSALVNEGLEEAIAAGVVTSVSLMVNTPGFDDAVRRAAAFRGRMRVGLHLNLTAGAPVAPPDHVRSLVDGAGRFLPLGALVRRALAGRVRPADVRREADAQLARMRRAGVEPTHVDGHRHVHALAAVRGALTAAARAAGVTAVRRPLEPPWARPFTAATLAKRASLAAAWAVPSVGPLPRPATASFRGLALLGSPRYAADLLALLDALPPGSTEVMVHPGRVDPAVAAWDPYVEARAVELDALRSARVRERLARGDLAVPEPAPGVTAA